MSPEQKLLRREISAFQVKLSIAQGQLSKLYHRCGKLGHAPIASEDDPDVAVCAVCGSDLGWYCSSSPIKRCEYNYADHGESCVHCGQPEERR